MWHKDENETQHSCFWKQCKSHKPVIFLISNYKLCDCSMFRIGSSKLADLSWNETSGIVMSNVLWKLFLSLPQFQRLFHKEFWLQADRSGHLWTCSLYVCLSKALWKRDPNSSLTWTTEVILKQALDFCARQDQGYMMWMCCALTQHQNCLVLVASVDNSDKTTCRLGQQCKSYMEVVAWLLLSSMSLFSTIRILSI